MLLESPPGGPVQLVPTTRILVVDDEELICSALRRLLIPASIECATDPVAALDLIRGGQRYDAVLCDLMMPIASGLDLYEQVLQIAGNVAARFVFITGSPDSPLARRARSLGTPPVLEKPFDIELLRETLRQLPDRLNE
ncbi:MAG: response regulator [Myxococcales bacterium]|nr:response regulator [Myxococcales bacterium]